MPVLSANGETIHYLKEGAGPAVALIHSLGSSVHMWREHDRRAEGSLHGHCLRRARPWRLVRQGRVQRRHRRAGPQGGARSARHFGMSSRRHLDRRAGGADLRGAVAGRGQVAGAGGYVCEAGRGQQGARRGDRGSDRLCVDGGVRHAIRGRSAAAVDVARRAGRARRRDREGQSQGLHPVDALRRARRLHGAARRGEGADAGADRRERHDGAALGVRFPRRRKFRMRRSRWFRQRAISAASTIPPPSAKRSENFSTRIVSVTGRVVRRRKGNNNDLDASDRLLPDRRADHCDAVVGSRATGRVRCAIISAARPSSS